MKIKRFMDSDMRNVLRRVREDQGPDAVILSNRRVDGGIEVITAVDYDEALIQEALGSNPDLADCATDDPGNAAATSAQAEVEVLSSDLNPVDSEAAVDAEMKLGDGIPSQEPALVQMRSDISSLRDLLETQLSGLVWKDRSRRSPLQAQMLRNLSKIGLAPDIASIIVNRTAPVDNEKDLWRQPLVTLTQALPMAEDRLLTEGGVAALIGPTGVGKTTTIAKMAARYAMQYGNDDIALVCADAYRIGAKEHLMAFANIIGTKVHAASTSDDLMALLDRLRNKRLVLIDTEGVSQRDMELSSRLAAYGDAADRVQFYLTMSAASQEAGLDETVRRYSAVPLAGAVVTKTDEAGQLGCIISTLIRHSLPIAYLSDGQRIPDDLHMAEKKRLWLINQAVECMEASDPRINERIMAENFAEAGLAHA